MTKIIRQNELKFPLPALTVSQPYASLLAAGEKFVENRTWGVPHRAWDFAIHAGSGRQYLSREELEEYPHGCVIAVVRLVGCYSLDFLRSCSPQKQLEFSQLTVGEVLAHEHTEGPVCWVIDDVRVIDEPLRCAGKQGMWRLFAPTAMRATR